MAYYIKAHRNGKSINLPVEDKHKYALGVVNDDYYYGTQFDNSSVKLVKSVDDPTDTAHYQTVLGTNTKGTCVYNSDNVVLLSAGSMFCLDKQGVDGFNEFIGDKIYLKSITYTIAINPITSFFKSYNKSLIESNIYSQVAYVTGTDHISTITTAGQNMSPPKPISMNLRLMLIKFDSGLTLNGYGDVNNGLLKDSDDGLVNGNVDAVKTMLAQWFNQSRIYLDASNNYQWDNVNNEEDEDAHLNECIQPLFTDRLRDSCKWSGKFTKLWDEKITFTGKPIYFDKTFTINKNCNLEEVEIVNSAGGSTKKWIITGDTLKNTYLVLFGPGCNTIDMCEPLHEYLQTFNSSPIKALKVFMNTKFTYYDV